MLRRNTARLMKDLIYIVITFFDSLLALFWFWKMPHAASFSSGSSLSCSGWLRGVLPIHTRAQEP